MNRTDRLYAIQEELRSAGAQGRTASRLASLFEVSIRTVKRDVSALQQGGSPIAATGGPGGGYVLDPAVTLPPLTFTSAEATALAVATALARDLPFGLDGRSAMAKVLAAMPDAARAEAETLAARVWVRTPETSSAAGADRAVSRVIDEGLRRRRVLVIDYVDGAGAGTQSRAVEPMLYARTYEHWYLLAWCRLRRAGRWFRLDRIAAARLTTQEVEERDPVTTFGVAPPDAQPVL